ncbi:MAG: FUSC family protein [Devosia sp.]
MTALAEHPTASAAGWLRPFRRLRDRLGASDPAFSRLRLASRALLALALNVGLLLGLAQLHALPFTAYGLAFVLSFNGSLAVRDKGSRAQAVTRAYAGLGAFAAVTGASLLAPWPLVGDLAFLAVIFAAVYLRRFGQRWTAVGMIGVMAYFMGNYTRPVPADLPWLALAIALALSVTQIVTNVLLRDEPRRDFGRALASLDQRVAAILTELASAPQVERPKLQAQLNRLRDIVMMAEGLIPQREDGGLAARGPASDLAIALFDVQLVTERLVRSSYVDRPPAALLRAALDRTPLPETDSVAAHLLQRLERSRSQIDTSLKATPSPFSAAGPAASAAKSIAVAHWWQRPELQTAVQVTLACAIAMTIGIATSPSRWYWAVITAFIVFNNTKSRADTAQRALQRSLGTMAGLVGGTIIATLLHGQPLATAALMPVAFFLAFYYLQVSYSVMIFFITIALALLYGLTGSFTPELLLLRLEETVIGAAAGTLVAFLIFPVRAATGIGAALDKYLKALADLVEAARGRAMGEAEPLHLLARSRLLDRAYTDLATAVRPIGGPWAAVTRFGEVRARLLLLSGIVHWARVLARSLPSGVVLETEQRRRIAEMAAEVASRIAAATASEAYFFDRPDEQQAEALKPRPPVPISEETDPALVLEIIARLLRRATPALPPGASK